ncbi:MAG: TIGR03905 family TSCPD domain-containing protein [Erysipelotrichaceae bacterium]|nr:TIGR03905 family TSCPD domain-containing protein [Erysipelotrichaceae bacterium]
MKFRYLPRGVCSTEYTFDIEDDRIKDVVIVNGCQGNLRGIRSLLIGMNIDEVIEKFEGITCGMKPTSCPDQISRALKAYKQQVEHA